MTQTSNIITKTLQPNFELEDEEEFVGGSYSFKKKKKTGTVYISYYTVSNQGEFAKAFVGSVMSAKKEKLYLEALRNLYKKIDFLELNQALDNREIDEVEFEKELTNNESKYLIPYPEKKPDAIQVFLVSDIVQRIGRVKEMTVDEASELFHLDFSSAENVLEDIGALAY